MVLEDLLPVFLRLLVSALPVKDSRVKYVVHEPRGGKHLQAGRTLIGDDDIAHSGNIHG